jgi:hypothetical protein
LLKGQVPVEQDPAEQFPAAHGKEGFSWTPALKEESCFSSFFPPHFGHAAGRLELDRINCSNTVEQ